jgi:chloride channel 3/4/5
MNSYPFLDNKRQPISDQELGEIVPRVRKRRIIDISNSPVVPATELREKLDILLMAGELDGGLPILQSNILVGLIPAPDLEFALDNLEDEENTLCLMSTRTTWAGWSDPEGDYQSLPTDFTRYIDPVCFSVFYHLSFLELSCPNVWDPNQINVPLTHMS